MDAARRVVLLELGMGLLWLALGVLNVGIDGLGQVWWVAAGSFLAGVTAVYADEHDLHGWDDWYRAAATVVGVVAWVIAVGIVVVLTKLSVLTVVGGALAGLGAGLLCYRFVYGVVRPVPKARLERASGRSV